MVDGEQGIARYCKGLISRGDNSISLGLYPLWMRGRENGGRDNEEVDATMRVLKWA